MLLYLYYVLYCVLHVVLYLLLCCYDSWWNEACQCGCQVDRSEWIRVQLALYADDRRLGAPRSALLRVASDTSIADVDRPSTLHSDARQLEDDDDDDEVDWTAVSPELDALCRHRRRSDVTASRPAQRTLSQSHRVT